MSDSMVVPNVRAVIAGSYKEYADWCRNRGISPRSRKRGVFYATPMSIRGYNGIDVVRVGTWRDRKDLREIEEMIAVANVGRRERDGTVSPNAVRGASKTSTT